MPSVDSDTGRPSEATGTSRRETWLAGWRFPVVLFVAWRIAHGVAVEAFGGSFFSSAFQFDAGYYIEIAKQGYRVTDSTYASFQTVAFFPLFPMLASPFIRLLGVEVGGSLIANALALGAFWAVWRAASGWFDERTGRNAVILLALWPASMFLWAFYSESLFILLTAAAFIADRVERRWLAVLLVFFVGLTRSVGLFFGPVLAVCRWWRLRRVDRTVIAYLIADLMAFVAMLLLMSAVADDPLAFSSAQEAWGRTPSVPWQPILDAVRHIVGELPRVAQETSMNLIAVILFLVLSSIGLARSWRGRNGEERPPLEPGLWTLTATMVPQFTTLISAMLRFMLSAWTGFVVAAVVVRDRPVLRWVVWAGSAAASLLLLRRYASNTFVA